MARDVRSRIVRDPIHGDTPIGQLQAAIVDTPIFQRLRYIKQNGLLHFVFPGAVHTRFSHSIGTMYLSGRVFASLFPKYVPATPTAVSSRATRYLGQVFETAALLHDCGHSAFSHSIEHVRVNGRAFIPPISELAAEWSDSTIDIRGWLSDRLSKGELDLKSEPTHEEVGLLLIGMLFSGRYERVARACDEILSVDPISFANDVRALIVPTLRTSDYFASAALEATEGLAGVSDVSPDDRPEQLKNALSALISGTVDVDRLDYLVRDSHFTGTLYGMCDVGVITNALELCVGESGGPLIAVGLRKRACQAVDDFIWSRYQLFAQVLNHKTNVVLNALLAEALEEATNAASLRIGPPRTLEEYLEFTDDYVMSAVISSSLRERNPRRRSYHRALVARELPLYLGRVDVTDAEDGGAFAIAEKKAELAHMLASRVQESDIQQWISESALIKGNGLPFVLEFDKVNGIDKSPVPPSAEDTYQLPRWSMEGRIPANVKHIHFFVDRELLNKR